ncbi:CHASE2 domain-containing protein [Thermodesulfobacteriota bacterium]
MGDCVIQHSAGTAEVPVDVYGSMLIRWRSVRDSFPRYSLVDVLDNRPDPGRVKRYKDKIVIVGIRASGQTRFAASPTTEEFPLDYQHSFSISNILTGDYVWEVPRWPYMVPNAAIGAIRLSFLTSRLRTKQALIGAIGASSIFALLAIGSFFLFSCEVAVGEEAGVFLISVSASRLLNAMAHSVHSEWAGIR